ncbi:hypothetical protein ACRAKI_21315 [Saccharothrix isguenensis]
MPTVAAGNSLASLGSRPVADDPLTREFGVYGHGPDAGRLMERVLKRIRSWDGESPWGARILHSGVELR